MDFRFFGQPFVQAFGVPPRCQRYQQRCHCRPNRSSHPSFGAHGPWTMDQLLEEARRQVKAEQASGAIGDYFTFLDSMLNGCHQRAQQQTSAKPAEKPEENGEKQEMKDQEKPKNETSETTELRKKLQTAENMSKIGIYIFFVRCRIRDRFIYRLEN